jgi:transposase InsO family protein
LRQDAQAVASSCHQCQLFNQHVPAFAPLSSLLAQRPFAHVAIDLIGPLPLSANGNCYTLVLVDVCTRFVFLEPLPNKSAFCVASVLFKIFCRFGFPQVIQSDNGTEFVNSLMEEFCALFNMQHRLSLPYHPRCNGIVEREVKTTIQVLCKQLCGLQDKWCNRIPAVEFSLNSKTHASFQFSPFALMFMRIPLLPVVHSSAEELQSCSFSASDAVERFVAFRQRLDEHFEAQVSRATRSAERFSRTKRIVNPDKFSAGDQVYKLNYDRRSKLDPVKAGPFIVESVHHGRSLVLRDPSGALLPKKVPISHVSKSRADLSEEEPEPIFVVERILNHREHEGETYYLVKWLGYDSSSNTWEQTHSFLDTSVIDRYWESLDLRGGNVNI